MADVKNRRLWNMEPSLWEAAQSVVETQPVPPGDPMPQGAWLGGTAVNLSTRRLRVSLWGPPEQLTLSLNKGDVWDRRRYYEPPLTLAEIKDMISRGELPGKTHQHYLSWAAYDFPCTKPVGQIIVRAPGLKGAAQPVSGTRLRDGSVVVKLARGNARAELTFLAMMTRNVIAIQGDFTDFSEALSFRLYRHRDTDERGKSYFGALNSDRETRPTGPAPLAGYDYSKDTHPDNGPMEPPEAGEDGRFFWIRQRLPAERTFPQGFEYVMVGLVVGPSPAIRTAEGEHGLGTPPFLNGQQQENVEKKGIFWRAMPIYEPIRNAAGAAATATLHVQSQTRCTFLVAVVTSAESADPLAEAKRQLSDAGNIGFDGLRAENAAWFKSLYERREQGRIFRGDAAFAVEQAREAFRSWTAAHHNTCDPDPTRFEAAVSYNYMEQDFDPFHGMPCYNELFFTAEHVRHRSERMHYYCKLVNFWLPACMKNAREVFGLPGAALLHGYLPPVLPDEYAHCTETWEFCMEIPAQVLRCLWECFDYGGDESFLAESVYPALRETAIFYSHYASPGGDGRYHVIPTVSAEHWGWTLNFERNRDSTSALCMFRWLLNRAAEASELLGVDADLRGRWREVAEKIAPYPTWPTPEGPVLTDVPGVNPVGVTYNWFGALYPTELADEINLDSPPEQREMMLRSAGAVKGLYAEDGVAWNAKKIPPLLGAEKGMGAEQLINSRSGRIHLFPAVPDGVNVAFRDMQARGGFEVSAERVGGEVTYVRIRSRRNVACRVMSPWPGAEASVQEELSGARVPHAVDSRRGECVEFPAAAGHAYLITHR